MRIYWWNGGLHIKPETTEDHQRVNALMSQFVTAQVGREDSTDTGIAESQQRQKSE